MEVTAHEEVETCSYVRSLVPEFIFQLYVIQCYENIASRAPFLQPVTRLKGVTSVHYKKEFSSKCIDILSPVRLGYFADIDENTSCTVQFRNL
jgi:hypothetical protein